MDELIESGREQIGKLLSDTNVRCFVDANVLQSGYVESHVQSIENLVTTTEVESELLQRPEAARSGLRVVAALKEKQQIATEQWFKDNPEAFSLLMQCAMSLAPSIRVRSFLIMQSELIGPEQAEEKAINQLATEGDFFACNIRSFSETIDVVQPYLKSVAKSTRRSWFRHPAKLRQKIAKGGSVQSDERLAGYAIANLFLRRERTCILSNDTDFAAIMKQFTDNMLWVASTIDCEISLGRIDLNVLIGLWEMRCKDLDRHREQCILQRYAEHCDDEQWDLAAYIAPSENELLVCRPENGLISRFEFSEKIFNFVSDFKQIAARHSLIKNGFWFPQLRVD